jgi:acyl-coenzyme A synthetase/AMP-(fatty) acid ligase
MVLDESMQPQPIGVPGEIHIGGDCLARGYVGRADSTAERFVPDPLTPGARLYRTGDVGRLRHDGAIEYVGRRDHQVKIRGYRIELGEIEATLGAHPSVAQVAVVADREGGVTRLVAYVATRAGRSASSADLREHAAKTLPEYMVPSVVMTLPTMPLTASGKVDRRALPKPDVQRRDGYVAPRDRFEKAVAQIWSEVLRVERVGITDNFFELGGHSLLATRVVSRIRALLGV